MKTKEAPSQYLAPHKKTPDRLIKPSLNQTRSANVQETLGTPPPTGDAYTGVARTVSTLPTSELERLPTAQWRQPKDRTLEEIAFFSRAMTTAIPSCRDSAINAFLRLTREQIGKKEMYTVEIFNLARWLLEKAHEERHIGNRAMAGKAIAIAGPYLIQGTSDIYECAQLLRIAAIEQHNDVMTMISAYRQLVHCFQPAHVEVAEGIATFSGLVTVGLSSDIRRVARETRNALVELKQGLPDGGNSSPPPNGGKAGGNGQKGPTGGHFLGMSGLAAANITPDFFVGSGSIFRPVTAHMSHVTII